MNLTNNILTDVSAGLTQLKNNPMGVLEEGHGAPVAILNRNKPAFYAVPAALYEKMVDELENIELMKMAQEAYETGEFVEVDLDSL
ncbi:MULTISPECIES: type II toxin-antitoxin system Phd/YefM family antitoxin [Vibrio]|uniref:Type II toxin-antitoxin system Phd/YefM family antitoxin n=1 Tax=Vibrio rumoiensis TaxID=76258 RepID=A0ABW7J0B0_9VIBR|nr:MULTISPECIES: antitoxin [Vibrio]